MANVADDFLEINATEVNEVTHIRNHLNAKVSLHTASRGEKREFTKVIASLQEPNMDLLGFFIRRSGANQARWGENLVFEALNLSILYHIEIVALITLSEYIFTFLEGLD
jgi:hypothetical protein